MHRFSNRVALVTGAASGIGRATAIRLASEGARVFLADINEAGLEQTMTAFPPDCDSETCVLDVTDSAACTAAVERCVQRFGRLDILCNIAGVPICEHLTEISDEQWHRAVSINLDGVFFLCRAAMPHLLATKGNIVIMSSSAGLVGQAYNSAYCATKAAVLMFGKSLALEYGKQGVRVNSVCPGFVKTPLTEGFNIPEGADMDLMAKLMPLTDGAEPDEIAAAVAYLASDEARFVTGVALPIDGAQTTG
jgi:meso-butanediol dehydrogenase/(S,S)-butanediol dehydrogenase/diacetyl reductase